MGSFAQWEQSANYNARITCGEEARMDVYTRTVINEPIPAELADPTHVLPLLPKIAENTALRAFLRT